MVFYCTKRYYFCQILKKGVIMALPAIDATINFGTIVTEVGKGVGEQFCLVIDTNGLTDKRYDEIFERLRNNNLECLRAKKDKRPTNLATDQYARHFGLERGIVIYAKKHQEYDAEHTKGKDVGVTIHEAFDKVRKVFDKQHFKYLIHPEALRNLEGYLAKFKEIGLEVAKDAIPELVGVERVVSELKNPPSKTNFFKNFQIGILFITLISLCSIIWGFFLQIKKDSSL
jgi:hypothetical protein